MTRQSAIRAVLAAAEADMSVREKPPGSNDHPRIRKALALCGLGPRYRYCAAMVALWGVEALGQSAWPLPRTADCDVLLAFARKRGILNRTPEVGDVGLLLRPGDHDDAFHAFLVRGLGGDGDGPRFATYEGNTNSGGSADGDGCYRRERTDTQHIVFVRWPLLLDDLEQDKARPWRLVVEVGKPKEIAFATRDGVGYCRLRSFLNLTMGEEATATKLGWDARHGVVTWEGDPLPSSVRTLRDENSETWASVADMCSVFSDFALTRDPANRLVQVKRA